MHWFCFHVKHHKSKHHKSKQHGMGPEWECLKCHRMYFIHCNFNAYLSISSDEAKERVRRDICRKTFKKEKLRRFRIRSLHTRVKSYVCDVWKSMVGRLILTDIRKLRSMLSLKFTSRLFRLYTYKH